MPPVLPIALKDELDSCVQRIADCVLSSDSDADAYDELMLALPRQVAGVVADAIAQRNARCANDRALAPELWCAVWRLLPFADRLAVSHVCRAWRASALSFPVLWMDVSVVYGDAHPGPGMDPRLLALGTLLDRSAAAPVRLRLCVVPPTLGADERAYIERALHAHAGHLRALRVQTQSDADVLPILRAALPRMTALRRARFETLDFDASVCTILDDSAPASAPLRVLELDGFVFDCAVALRGVEDVRYTVTERPLTPLHLAHLFRACPRLAALHLDLQAGWWDDGGACLAEEHAPARLQTLSIAIFSAGELHAAGILRYLRSGARARVSLRFAYNSAHDSCAVFADLDAPTVLEVRAGGVRAEDARGFVREVVWAHRSVPDGALAALVVRCAPSLRRLVVDAALWLRVAPPLAAASRLQQLALRLCRADELPAHGGGASLPALQTLRVELVDSAGRPCAANGAHRLDAARALALVQALRGGAPLAVLQLAQVRFRKTADRTVLERLRGLVGALETPAWDADARDAVVAFAGDQEWWD